MDKKDKTIIAIGGGGFSHEPENPLLDLYVLKQSTKKKPKICFLPAANPNPALYTKNFQKAFSRYDCKTSALSLLSPHTADLSDFLLSQDIIYVGGGNTKSMIALWQTWHIDKILRQAWEQGIVLAGVSAGAICWFEHGFTDSIPGTITLLPCLGLLKGTCCPHYDGEPVRQQAVKAMMAEDRIQSTYVIDDSAAIHFSGNEVKTAVSSVKGKKAAFINHTGRHDLSVDYLGD